MSQTSISVIIPVYNAEEYLETCLISIQKQTYSPFEVWLIDDGSNDKSGKICDTYQTLDSRFHVIHKPNGGVSSARNMGIEHVKGEWICFIDSDDTVEENYLQTLHQSIGEKKDILIIQGFNTIFHNGKKEQRLFNKYFYSSTEIYKTFQDSKLNRCGFPFGKLYNKDIINQNKIRFDEQIHYAEDVMFMLTYLCHVSAIQTVSGANYNYFIRNNKSLSQRIFSFESEYICYQTYLNRLEKLEQRFNLPYNSTLKTKNVISEYLIRRSVGSLYQPSTKKIQVERIAILKSFTYEQISFLQKYYTECNWFHKVTVFLLSKQYYYLCDWFNQCIAWGRTIKQLIK
jgi:glycosyltransferase involved in cell wall biosynthesis